MLVMAIRLAFWGTDQLVRSDRLETLISLFQKYAAFYDLLYRDKDYAAEAEYVARTIRSIVPDARTILELGSGTGRHGR